LGTQIGTSLKESLQSVTQGIGQGIGQNISQGIMSGIRKIGGALLDTKNLAEFDAASRKSSTLTTDIKGLEKGAMSLAKELGNTASGAKILDSAYDVLSSGFSKTSDVLNILKASQIGAVGGFADVNEVANATTSVINAYGLAAKDAASIVQQMSGTQNAGKLTIADYASNIGKLASTAAQAGIPLEQINGIISVATAKGVRVSSAFDGVRAAISSVLKPSGDATKLANSLGVEFSAAALKSKGLVGIIQDLTAKGQATPENLIKLFGSVEAVAAIAPIAGKGLEDYAKALKTIKETDANDAFQKVAGGIEKQQEALQNKLKDLDVSIKQGAVGDALASGFKLTSIAVDGLIKGLEGLNAWYSQLTPQSQGLVQAIGGVVAILGAAATAIAGIGIAIGLIGPPLIAAGTLVAGFATGIGSIALATAPIAIPIAAIGAAIYGLATAMGATDTQAFTASLAAMGAGLALLFGPAAIGAVTTGVTALVTGFGSIAVAATAALVPLLPWIAAAAGIAAALYGLYKVYEMFKPQIDRFVVGIVDGFNRTVSAAGKWIVEISQPLLGFLGWCGKLISASLSLAGAVTVAFGNMLLGIGKGIANFVSWAAQSIGNFTSKIWQQILGTTGAISNAWNNLWSSITSATAKGVGSAGNKITQFGSGVISTFSNTVSSVLGSIDKWLQSLGLVPKNVSATGVVITAFKTVVSSAFAGALGFIVSFKDGAIAAFNLVVDKIKEMVGFITDLPNKIQAVADKVNIFNGGKPSSQPQSGAGVTVSASTYHPGGGGDNGREIDARGRKLTANDLAVAIPGLGLSNGIPYGSQVKVSNPRTGLSSNATVRDTGPLAQGRELDITTAVAKAIGFNGLEPLKVELIKLPPGADPNKSYTFGKSTNFETAGDKWLSSVVQGTQIKASGGNWWDGAANAVNGLFGGGNAVASPVGNKSLADAIASKGVVPGLGNFGAPRKANSTGKHNGVDFNGPVGTPVYAPHDGTATYSGGSDRVGSRVTIKSSDGSIRTVLLHVSDESKKFFANGNSMPVRAGQQVGEIGTFGARYRDGTVTGSKTHVHVEMRVNGKLEDPTKVLGILEKSKRRASIDSPGAIVAGSDLGGLGGLFKDGKPLDGKAKPVTANQLESLKISIEDKIRAGERQNENIKNRVLTGDVSSQETADQVILSNRIATNAELQKSIPLIKQFKAAASNLDDVRTADELLDRLARINAETISANRGDNLATIKGSIDKQIESYTNRNEDIINSGGKPLDIQSKQLANQQLYNEELQKTIANLQYLESIATGDAIAPIQAEIRRVQKFAADTKTATTEYQKAESTSQLESIRKRVETSIKVGDQRQTAVTQSTDTEQQKALAILTIRQQTAKVVAEAIPGLELYRNAQTDPAMIEQANELLANIRARAVETRVATEEAKKLAYETSVVGRVSIALKDTLGTGLGDVLRDAGNGFRNLGSILDSIINKVADIGINAIVGAIGGGGNQGTGILGSIGSLFGFKDGGTIRNYAAGGTIGAALNLASAYSKAMQREGAGAVPIVGKVGEEMLSIPNAKIYRSMLKDGTWADMSKIYNYASAGTITANGAKQTAVGRSTAPASRQTSQSITIERINGHDFVSYEDLQSIMEGTLPEVSDAAVNRIDNKFRSPGQRNRWGV
jgi:TP901 family phage tail tape measure protein